MKTAEISLPLLKSALEEVKKFFFKQGPIEVFIHQNILLDLEHLSFEEAVKRIARLKGAKVFMRHEQYCEAVGSGRISPSALQQVFKNSYQEKLLRADFAENEPFQFFKDLLLNPLHDYPLATLRWLLTQRLPKQVTLPQIEWFRRKIALYKMCGDCEGLAQIFAPQDAVFSGSLPYGKAHFWQKVELDMPRQWYAELMVLYFWKKLYALFRARNKPVENMVEATFSPELLAKANQRSYEFLPAYFDEGISYWPIQRDSGGMLATYASQYSLAGSIQELLFAEGENLAEKNVSERSLQVIIRLLQPYSLTSQQLPSFLFAIIRDVTGWAGLICFFESKKQGVSFEEFVALRLLICHQQRLAPTLNWTRTQLGAKTEHLVFDFISLVLAKHCSGAELETMTSNPPLGIVDFMEEFDSFEKCKALHLAFENSYYAQVGQALLAKNAKSAQREFSLLAEKKKSTSFSAIFCIDDREESIRRYLEELEPACETYSYAGFFNIDMLFKGVGSKRVDGRCPVVITPMKVVEEQMLSDSSFRHYCDEKIAMMQRVFHQKSRTLVAGTLLHLSLLLITIFSDLLRFLAPNALRRSLAMWMKLLRGKQRTRLTFNSGENSFSNEDMVARISTLVRTIGLNRNFTDLVYVVGHGSSQRNNPHSSAYDCGACGGKRGGANGRAFAEMANNPEVRELLAAEGVSIPVTSWFVGGYHDTCSDEIEFFDVDLIPSGLRPQFTAQQRAFLAAAHCDAAERARRLQSIPFLSPAQAYERVQARSQKYAQPRPEIGHQTNAICIVGRRELSRGIFFDRRAFLCSYSEADDVDGALLVGLVNAVVPVCVGISLDYYFGYVDNEIFGAGSKLPHNVTALHGVMNGALSDLRTGLPWQMVEIHEPLRLLMIIEAPWAKILSLRSKMPYAFSLAEKGWMHLAAYDHPAGQLTYLNGEAVVSELSEVKRAANSLSYIGKQRQHLEPCLLEGEG